MNNAAVKADPTFLPWARPHLWGGEEELVLEALRSSWISGGPFVDRFETLVREFLGSSHVVATSNGTSALQLAYLGLGLEPGDEVVVPNFGFLAAANVALQMRLVPVFCDVDPQTWCMRASDVEPVITQRTKAIVAVHTYGNMCEINPLADLARRRGIPLIEDAAEALGSRYDGRRAGTFGTIGTLSFHATKTLTTGEGGMVVTDDAKLAETMRLYSSHGLRRVRHYWHEVPGNNFRLTNLQAALGCAQFAHLPDIIARRADMNRIYRQHLAGMNGIALQGFEQNVEPVVWAIAVRLDPNVYPQGRDQVMQQMLSAGIETRPGFYSPAQIGGYGAAPLPSDELSKSVISLPSYPHLTEQDIKRVCDRLAAAARGE